MHRRHDERGYAVHKRMEDVVKQTCRKWQTDDAGYMSVTRRPAPRGI